MDRSSVTEQFVRTVGTFALIGPPVGAMVMWIWLIAPAVAAGVSAETGWSLINLLGSTLGSVLLSLIVGYVLGVVPATITGVICHFFAQAVRGDAAWVVACMVTGAVVGAWLGLMFIQSMELGLPGAVAAMACSVSLRHRRWR